ncbi:MAG: CHAT domain-containing protein, partial [Parachlamydiaceae bacterium]
VLLKQKKMDQALEVTDVRRSPALISALSQKSALKDNLPSLSTLTKAQNLAQKLHSTFVLYSFSLGVGVKPQLLVWIIPLEGETFYRYLSVDAVQTDFNRENFHTLLENFPFDRKNVRGGEGGSAEALNVPLLNKLTRGNTGEALFEKHIVEEFAKDYLEKWYRTFIAPIQDYLPQDPQQVVTIIPDGCLSHLPFAAFRAPDGKYLIQKHPLSIAPSIHALYLLDELSSQRESAHSENCLIIGNPKLDDPDFKDLTIGEKEAQEVGALLKAKAEDMLLGEKMTPSGIQATSSAFLEKAPQARWIFASCHGEANSKPEFDPHSVFEGHLKFSPDLQHPHGNLHSQQISQLDLKAELVFLSACYSGTGKIQQEGVIGNVWSFLSAGASSVVATYWPLAEDELTKEMVLCFYRHLLGIDTPKLNKAQALQKAMIYGIEKKPLRFDQWGAFFLSGLIGERPERDVKAPTGDLESVLNIETYQLAIVEEVEGHSYGIRNKTRGDGACAIHALLGELCEGQWVYLPAGEAIESQASIQIKAKEAFLEAIIQAKIEGRSIPLIVECLHDFFQEKNEEYRQFLDNLQKEKDTAKGTLIEFYHGLLNTTLAQGIQGQNLVLLLRKGAEGAIDAEETEKSKRWKQMKDAELFQELKSDKIACYNAFETVRESFMEWLKKESKGKFFTFQDILKNLNKALEEMDKQQEAYLLDEACWETYVKEVVDSLYYLTDRELELAACLFNKKVVLCLEEGQRPLNRDATGEKIVIHHRGQHYSRLELI